MMNVPPLSATYRLQFRGDMTFERAAELAPYLADLGVSHLYASPIFQAVSGSTHGYDIVDYNALDTTLGGLIGFEKMSEALQATGLGLILDIVPNHMAFSLETPWLRDVLRHGPRSRYAQHFDIDWSRGRLVLPFLEKPFAVLNAEGAFAVATESDGPALSWSGMAVPIAPGGPTTGATSEEISLLHDAQSWRLTDWRLERDGIHHRRFFNITSLIGVRVEEAQVFEDVHALLFDLIDAGQVQGIRIDHVDGLADPTAYLARLRARVGETPVWVEKILTPPEVMPAWPVEGTTGYEAGAIIAAALTDADGAKKVHAAYDAYLSDEQNFDVLVQAAKHEILENELAAERLALAALIETCAAEDPVGRDYGPDTLLRALIELCVAIPVYRSYLDGGEVTEIDKVLLYHASVEAASQLPERAPLDFILMQLKQGTSDTARALRVRFQQVTGALMAKAKEDTAFYRLSRLLSANDVGAEPDIMHFNVGEFHAAMEARLREQPYGLTLTSSHDTKRSEDARMRAAAITRSPEAFAKLMTELDALDGASDVPAHVRWYIGQSLLAVWGEDPALEDRIAEHMRKALREGKQFTTWTHPDAAFEDAVLDFACRAVRHGRKAAVPVFAPVLARAEPLILVQTALKLLVPGVPDIYQGCEAPDFSLTDPDNRRSVDFAALAHLAHNLPLATAAVRKNSLTRACLGLRRVAPDLFTQGEYRRLRLPPGLLGFVRSMGERSVALIARPGNSNPALPALILPELEGMRLVWGEELTWLPNAVEGPSIDPGAFGDAAVLVLALGI